MTIAASPAEDPFHSDEFARVYEAVGHRLTGPISVAALDIVGSIGPSTRLIDIGAGAGALSLPAAQRGARVLAVDIAPGMVRRVATALKPYFGCEARVMNGEALDLEDESFDVSFSIFGAITFSDWRKGLAEQARVTRRGGKACVAAWTDPRGGGPFALLSAAMQAAFPERSTPPAREAFAALSSAGGMRKALVESGLHDVVVHEVEGTWVGPAGERYLHEVRELYGYARPYAMLDYKGKAKVDKALVTMTSDMAVHGEVRLTSLVTIGVGAPS